MDCNRVKQKLVRYMDRDLPPRQYQEVSEHLDHCYICSEELTELVAATDIAASLLRCGTYRNRFSDLAATIRTESRLERPTRPASLFAMRRAVMMRGACGGLALAAAAVIFITTLGLPAVHAIHSLHETIQHEIQAAETPVPADSPVGNPVVSWSGRIRWAESLNDRALNPVEPQPECIEDEPVSGGAQFFPTFSPSHTNVIVRA